MQGCVKEKGCEEGRATWVKRCPSGRLYAHPTTPSPLHTLSPLSLKDRSLNPCAQRFRRVAPHSFQSGRSDLKQDAAGTFGRDAAIVTP